MSKKFVYTPIEDVVASDIEDGIAELQAAVAEAKLQRAKVILYISGVLFGLALLALTASLTHLPSELECAKRVSPYSPMWEAVEFWEGSPENNFNHSSTYRGPPTPEREKAWNDLWHYKSIAVDDAGVKALNKTRPGIKHHPIVGSDPKHPQYGAVVQVFHQLHCLNLVRQYTWLDVYEKDDPWYPVDLSYPIGGRMHVDHCLEELRLSLMCYGDVTPVLIQFDEHRAVGRVADFSVHRKCRNFDRIVDYVEANGVSIGFSEHEMPHVGEKSRLDDS